MQFPSGAHHEEGGPGKSPKERYGSVCVELGKTVDNEHGSPGISLGISLFPINQIDL